MRKLLSKINIPTVVAVTLIIAVDRMFDVSGMALKTVGASPKR